MLRVGIFGAGRTRNGLGPFLARAAEAAGAQVVMVAGRDLAAAERTATALAASLGHAVAAAPTADALAAQVEVLFVAAPIAAHAVGLQAALAHSRPCLAEKPLLPLAQGAHAQALAEAFFAHGILLAENCQWPFVLDSMRELFPQLADAPVREVRMGLSPSATGLLMVEDSLSHALSVVQAVARPAAGGALRVRDWQHPDPEHLTLTCALPTETGELTLHLELSHTAQQPRQAWLSLNGFRADRRIGNDYQFSLASAERTVPLRDPMHALVARFLSACGDRDDAYRRQQVAQISQRARWAQSISQQLKL